MLTIDLKRKFSSLASALSPENLSCDGELSRQQVQRKKAALMKQWGALEREAGRRVTETEVESWYNELRADAQRRQAELETKIASNNVGGMEHKYPNVWLLKGRNGLAAFYIQNWGYDRETGDLIETKPFVLYSEFASRLDGREEIGKFVTLQHAYDAGMAYLKTVTAERWKARWPLYSDENLRREMERLP
jgi:predicted transcriptional regulator